MKLEINKKEYEVKLNLRSYFIFEQITKKPFSLTNMFDEYILFYSCLLSGNKDFDLSFDDFITYMDDRQDLFIEFLNYITEEQKRKSLFKDDEEDKKKVTEEKN